MATVSRRPKLVGEHKGRVNTRKKTVSAANKRVEELISQHVTGQVAERQELAKQWITLRRAGVPWIAITEEYHVSTTTVMNAVNDTENWCRIGRTRKGQPIGSRCSRVNKRTKTTRKTRRR